MSSFLPAPIHAYTRQKDVIKKESSNILTPSTSIPSYPHRVQQRFIPRTEIDFGDGGAYPEIHLAQFPLQMGKKSTQSIHTNALALQVHGENGHVNYDAVVTQHHRDKAKVFTQYKDLVEKDQEKTRPIPTSEEEAETTNRTRDALEQLIQGKISSAHPVNITRQKTASETSTYIRYTPHDQGKMSGSSTQRIIRMVEVAKDPMEPPKFQHKKAVRGPPSPPVPILHSPPRKLTVKDQQAWKIPPCISNWKNSKGFTIALDKRLAADGRGLQQPTVNDNFASFAEALAIAERKAREEVNMRAQVAKKAVMKQKEQKEQELRELAAKARMERAGIRTETNDLEGKEEYSEDEDDRGRVERDRIRLERKKERERELRMEKIGKKGKLTRDEDRDVSEKIALGQLQGTGKLNGDALFDARLFNQTQGIGSGFGADDEYSVYSKPMIDRGKASVYRPKGQEHAFGDGEKEYQELKEGSTKRFKADKQFRGTEQVGHGRDGPVQFSYDVPKDDEKEGENDKKKHSSSPRHSRRRSPSRSSSRSRSRERVRGRRRSPSRSRSNGRKRQRRKDRSESVSGGSDSDDPYGLDQFLTEARTNSTRKHEESPRRRR